MTQSERSAFNIIHTVIINLLLIYKAVENHSYNINEASYWGYLIVNSFMAVNQGSNIQGQGPHQSAGDKLQHA